MILQLMGMCRARLVSLKQSRLSLPVRSVCVMLLTVMQCNVADSHAAQLVKTRPVVNLGAAAPDLTRQQVLVRL